MKKKVLAGLLALTMVLGAGAPVTEFIGLDNSISASAADTDYKRELKDDGTVRITKYTGKATDVVIPETLGGRTVTEIGNGCFYDNKNIKSVTMPDTIKIVDDGAFRECLNLESVTLPKNLLLIGDYTFSYCKKLKNITIPNTVKEIKGGAFRYCTSLTSFNIPDSVTNLGSYFLGGCTNLETVSIGKGAKYIPTGAFSDCTKLKSVDILSNINYVDTHAFGNCKSLLSIELPNSVTGIYGGAFAGCSSLTEIDIPKNVTIISWDAFRECSKLNKVTLHEGLKEIDDGAFIKCPELKEITIPKSVKTLYILLNTPFSISTKIYCYKDSEAEKYAMKYGNDYELLHEHTYTEKVTTPATCTADGEKTYTCSVCGDKYTEKIPALGHSYQTSVVKPTYSAKGYTLHKCKNCGDSYKDNYTAQKTVGRVSTKKSSKTSSAIRLNWNKVSDASGYRIYQYDSASKKWKSIKTINGGSKLTYRVSKLKANKTYKFKVKAYVRSSGKVYWGSASPVVSVKTKK